MTRARLRHATLLAALIALSLPCPASGVLPLDIDLRAREMGPGEPVRVRVRSAEPLASLEGEFCKREIFFVRDDATGRRWSGWSMIDLEEQPGPAAVEVRGRSAQGRTVAGTRAVSIEPGSFPTESLEVQPSYVEPPPEVRERLARERETLSELYRGRSRLSPPTRFVRPVPGEPTSIFGTRRVYNGQPRSPHPGLDLRAADGTPVASSGDGRVALAQDLYYSGNTVIVDHGGGLFTLYAHLSEIRVAPGDDVRAGQVLGLSGATGRVTGPHLHWGAKIGNAPFNPTALLDPRLFDEEAPAQ